MQMDSTALLSLFCCRYLYVTDWLPKPSTRAGRVAPLNLIPLLNGIKTLLRIGLLAAVTMQINRNADLLPQQLGQVAAISEVHPFALPAALLLVLPLAVEHPVVSLGT